MKFNGTELLLAPPVTLKAVLALAGIEETQTGIAVAVDGVVIPRGQWATLELNATADIEVVSAFAGG